MKKHYKKHHIRDPIHGPIKLDELEFKLINTPEFRRLKRIKQLSFAQYEYPSANHTRFEHCIGTLLVTKRIINSLKINSTEENAKLLENNETYVKIAALLHDVGHSAFSHSIEQVLSEHPEWTSKKINHEENGFKIITGKGKINQILKEKFSEKEIMLIATIAMEKLDLLDKNLHFLTDIITGDLGSDRIDYLVRDSYHAGLSYGNIEVEQLISNLCISLKGPTRRVCIKYDEERKGLSASTFLLIGRQHHFDAIVHQPKIRCANVMLKKAFELYIDSIDNQEKEILNCFTKYDDYDLLNKMITNNKSESMETIKEIVALIKDELPLKEHETSFKRIDDFPPQVIFMLQIINQDKDLKSKFRQIIEKKIRKKNKLKKSDLIIFDMDLNGTSGIPSSLYLEADNSKSCLIFDKAPLTEDLSIILPKMGSLAIYSKEKINVNFFEFVQEITQLVNDKREKELIREESLLISILMGITSLKHFEKKIDQSILHRDIDLSFPGIARLIEFSNNFFKKNKIQPYNDFIKLNDYFLYSPKFYKEIILLASCNLINIIRKPVCIDNNNKPCGLEIKNLQNIKSMVSRYDFSLTSRAIDYIFNFILKSKKCKEYSGILGGLK